MFGDFVLLLAMIQLGAVTAITAAVVGAVFLSIDQFQIEALRFAVVPTSSPGKLHQLQKQLVGLGGLVALAIGTVVKAGLAVKKPHGKS